jgi:hypothetical protein
MLRLVLVVLGTREEREHEGKKIERRHLGAASRSVRCEYTVFGSIR